MFAFAVGRLGLDKDAFFNMTWCEYDARVIGYWEQEQEEWDRTRSVIAMVRNTVVKQSDQKTPQELVPLPKDKYMTSKPKSSVSQFEKAKRRLGAKIEVDANDS